MPVFHNYGTVGATGTGFVCLQGNHDWLFQRIQGVREGSCYTRPSWKDPYQWYSLWSFGCRTGGGDLEGYAPANCLGLADHDPFEPFSCDGDGSASVNFLRGICKDANGVAVANATVQAFRTSDGALQGTDSSRDDGSYGVGVKQPKTTAHYLVAYKVGTPDTTGTTVNTLLPTNVDGT